MKRILARLLLFTMMIAFILTGPMPAQISTEMSASLHASGSAAKNSIKDDIERVDIEYKAKPENPAKPARTDPSYKLMGVKWDRDTLPVTYIVNPANPYGIEGDAFVSDMGIATEVWDDETATELFNAPNRVDTAVYGVLDGKNAVAFGNYPQDGVIAVTSIWYNRKTKSIVEFDMLFDTDFNWGDAKKNPVLMDVLNIATHEFGHSIGLADLYSSSYAEQTMYGYATEGETMKRTLESGDIAGLEKMYGP